jgi:hypothetical protein
VLLLEVLSLSLPCPVSHSHGGSGSHHASTEVTTGVEFYPSVRDLDLDWDADWGADWGVRVAVAGGEGSAGGDDGDGMVQFHL